MLVALQEAGSALVSYAHEQNKHQALAEEETQNQRSLSMADSLYSNGRVNFLDVLDARRSLYESEDQLAESDQAVALDLIVLYKALGGGSETQAAQPNQGKASP